MRATLPIAASQRLPAPSKASPLGWLNTCASAGVGPGQIVASATSETSPA